MSWKLANRRIVNSANTLSLVTGYRKYGLTSCVGGYGFWTNLKCCYSSNRHLFPFPWKGDKQLQALKRTPKSKDILTNKHLSECSRPDKSRHLGKNDRITAGFSWFCPDFCDLVHFPSVIKMTKLPIFSLNRIFARFLLEFLLNIRPDFYKYEPGWRISPTENALNCIGTDVAYL